MTGYDTRMKLPTSREDSTMAGTAPEALTAAEVTDERDVSPRAEAPDTSGKRVRAIPYKGGTTVIVDETDFRNNDVKQKTTTWDFRKDNFTVKVGNGENNTLTKEAAEMLTRDYPTQFEYLSE